MNFKTSTIRHYANLEASLLDLEKDNFEVLKKFRLKAREKGEHEKSKLGVEDYEVYALLGQKALHLCKQLYSESLWEEPIRLHFIPLFERVRRQYWDWLMDNRSAFDQEFFKFMKGAEWRKLLNPEHADQLRWVYEVDLFEKIILSPLHPDLKDDLFTLILGTFSEIFGAQKGTGQEENGNTIKNISIVDLGCGKGELTRELIDRVSNEEKGYYISESYCIDYSPSMIQATKEKFENEPRVKIHNGDMRDLSAFSEKFDVAFSINSILPRNPDDMPTMLEQSALTLKNGGYFIAILPSFDTVIELKKLDQEKEKTRLLKSSSSMTEDEAETKAKEKIDQVYKDMRMLDEKKYLYADDGVNPQRFFC